MDFARRARILAIFAAFGVLLGLWTMTETLGALFHFPRVFGGGLFDIDRVRLYAPWRALEWRGRYAALYPRQFGAAGFLGLLAGLALVIVGGLTTRGGRPPPPVFGANAWAQLPDLRKAGLIARDDRISGRVFGRFGGRLITYEGNKHALIIGASQSGKGYCHVVSSLIAWPHSALIYDRKGELWHITADHRKRFSHVLYFAPTDPATARWNPLFEVRKGVMEIADIQNIVGILVDPLGKKGGDLSFWDQSATDFFTAVILHVLYSEPDEKKNLAQVRRLMINIKPTLHAMINTGHRRQGDPKAIDGLARDIDGNFVPETHPEVLLGARALESMEDRVRSSVLATARASLSLWADPMVEYATSWSDFSIGDLVCSKHPVSLYILTPQAHADRLAFLVRVFMRQSINSLMEEEHKDSRGRDKRHPLLLMLDEFPKLGSLPFLENALGEMSSYGMTAHLICQSFNDVISKYGEKTSLFDNIHITAAFATSEPGSIDKVIRRAGKALELRDSFSDPRSLFGRAHRSTSRAEQQRYILSEEDVRGLSSDQQFIFVNNTKPILAEKIRYFEEPFFQEKAGDYYNGVPAAYDQGAGEPDVPREATIDWLGVKPEQEAPEPFQGLKPPQPPKRGHPHDPNQLKMHLPPPERELASEDDDGLA